MKKLLLLLLVLTQIVLIGCQQKQDVEPELKYDKTEVVEAEVLTIGIVKVTSIGLRWRTLLTIDTSNYPIGTTVYVNLYLDKQTIVKSEIVGIATQETSK